MNKIREATVPLPIDSIKEFFQDKEIKFLIDYENSKIKDQVFLTYVSNLDIPIDLKINKDFDKTEVFKLITHYMQVKTISNIPFLNMAVAHIVLKASGLNTASEITNSYFTEDEVDQFINENSDLVAIWLALLNSIPLFMIKSFNDLNEHLKVEQSYQVLDDQNAVGMNVVNLITMPGFMKAFFTTNANAAPMIWFKQQFESYMFKGRSLFEFVSVIPEFQEIMLALNDGKLPKDARDFFKNNEIDLEVSRSFS
jgi:hypothetical protein